MSKALTLSKVLLASWALWLWSGRCWATLRAFSTTVLRVIFRNAYWWSRSITMLLCSWLREQKKWKETIMLSDVSPDDYHDTNSYLVNQWNSSLSHPTPYPLVIRVFTISQAVFTSATSLRASAASSLSLWASWLPFSSSHRRECCRDWSSSSSWTKNCSLEEMNGKYNVD